MCSLQKWYHQSLAPGSCWPSLLPSCFFGWSAFVSGEEARRGNSTPSGVCPALHEPRLVQVGAQSRPCIDRDVWRLNSGSNVYNAKPAFQLRSAVINSCGTPTTLSIRPTVQTTFCHAGKLATSNHGADTNSFASFARLLGAKGCVSSRARLYPFLTLQGPTTDSAKMPPLPPQALLLLQG
jgi:hypothetical protein